jgi:hypothetical protein
MPTQQQEQHDQGNFLKGIDDKTVEIEVTYKIAPFVYFVSLLSKILFIINLFPRKWFLFQGEIKKNCYWNC